MATAEKKGPSLTELVGEFEALDALLFESEGEITPEIEAWLAEYDLAEKRKADAYAFYLKDLGAQIEAAKKIEQELASKRRVLEGRVEWLKSRMLTYLETRKLTEVRGEVWKLSRSANGGKLPMAVLVEADELPDELVMVMRVPNMEKIRTALEAAEGGELLGEFEGVLARLLPRGHHLRVG